MPDVPLDPATYRQVIGRFPTGVAVVTCVGEDGPAGLTTNAISSLSLDPLLMLVCFDNGSRTLTAVRHAGRFAVSILRDDQEDVARVFASKRAGGDKLQAVLHRIHHGVPVVDDAAAWLVCELRELLPGGDHTIGIGAVVDAGEDPDATPLLFHRGAFDRMPDAAAS
ncbi:flavin reductase family protein [Patulibacter defluvii]|uniref:flavin reductase family protein n=1 Tax=Patulibacter defluvii TaxID=3095358 RepID=UPI002A75452E|nr:flavin reductase family protein [Patulibacter sp. DM4]